LSEETPRPDETIDPAPETPEVVEELAPPDPLAVEKAEGLIRQSHLAKMRNQGSVADRLLKEAADLAGNSPVVLEAIGDDFAERRQYRKAKEIYDRARKLDPTSKSLENKYGEMVLRVDLHIDPATYNENAGLVSGKAAVVLSAILPGLGQIVSGQVVKGSIFLAIWGICFGFVLALPGGIGGMVQYLLQGRGPTGFTPLSFAFLVGAVLMWLMAIFDASVIAKRFTPVKVDRPLPPSDLPF